MKEYKVKTYKSSLTNNDQRLQDFLNKFAVEGWQVITILDNYQIILEREKNR